MLTELRKTTTLTKPTLAIGDTGGGRDVTNNFDMEVPGLDELGYGSFGGEGKLGCKR